MSLFCRSCGSLWRRCCEWQHHNHVRPLWIFHQLQSGPLLRWPAIPFPRMNHPGKEILFSLVNKPPAYQWWWSWCQPLLEQCKYFCTEKTIQYVITVLLSAREINFANLTMLKLSHPKNCWLEVQDVLVVILARWLDEKRPNSIFFSQSRFYILPINELTRQKSQGFFLELPKRLNFV